MPAPKTLREPVRGDLVLRAKQYPDNWIRTCSLQQENSEVGLFVPEPQQVVAMNHVLANQHSYIIKYRQAKISTLMALLLLNKTMYHRAMKSLLIANDEATARVLFGRIAFAYRNIAQAIRIDAELGPSVEAIQWPSSASINAITGGGDTPVMGNSPDRYLVTEYGFYKNQEVFNEHFFPAITKRPNSWGVIETTPGTYQSVAHQLWLSALAEDSESRLAPLFLEWWKDITCTSTPPARFVADNEELRLMEKYPGLTMGHIYFRRRALATEFAKSGDKGFRHKYPFHKYDGWEVTGGTPAIPQDVVEELLLSAVPTPDFREHYFKGPESGEKYLVTVDPNSYGKSGDPSALKVWNRYDREEVACFHGREDPGLLADRACKIASKYNNAALMIESNKAECIASVRTLGYKNLFSPNDTRPGWFATDTTKGDAVAAMVDMLREKELIVRSRSTCNQLAIWDGDASKRSGTGKNRHHFDQVTTTYMASWFFRKVSAGLRPDAKPAETKKLVAGGVSARALDIFVKKSTKSGPKNVLGVYSSRSKG